jgi:hypothetical protein
MSEAPSETLALHLYEFARQQFRDELHNGLRRLRSIRGTRALFVVDFFSELNITDRQTLSEACLHRAHPSVPFEPETLTSAHHELLKRFDDASLSTGANWKYIPIRSKRKYRDMFCAQGRALPPEAVDADFADDLPARLDRRVFFNELKTKITASWNKPVHRGPGEWELSVRLGEVTITLNLDFGGNSDQLNYCHDIGPDSARFLSIGRWLGVRTLSWDLCTSADSQSVADSVSKLADEFLDGVRTALLK